MPPIRAEGFSRRDLHEAPPGRAAAGRALAARAATSTWPAGEPNWLGSPAGAAAARLPEHDRRQVLADLEAALAPWVDADGLRVVTEANTAVATR
ncbi:MAG TPA: hypothetical protein VFA46_07060 [Actinomycetes bacterium]|jgi:hypothetical protein|nr:hypothetical protein [Actinomycetes bacterium]